MKRHILTLLSASLMIACGPANTQDPKEPDADPDAGPCSSVEVDGQTYCVWQGAILIETGYECPQDLGYLHTFDAMNLAMCSDMETPPNVERVGQIRELLTAGARECPDISADYRALQGTFDTSCTQDTDCTSYTTHCHLAADGVQCPQAVNTTADLTGLEAFNTEYDGLSCRANQAQCMAPPCGVQQEPKCENSVCVMAPVEEEGPRTCASIETDYRALEDTFDTTCTQDSDCTSYSPHCHLAVGGVQCPKAVNTSADLTGLETFNTEYDGMSCRANQGNCMAPPCGVQQEPKCENNLCVMSIVE